MNYKIISMDFDGTLLTSDKKVTDKTKQVLLKYKNDNYVIIGVTARTLASVSNVCDINMFNYLILNNGSYIYDVENSEEININNIDRKIAIDITNYFKDYAEQIDYCSLNKYYIYKKKIEQNKDFLVPINSIDEINETIGRMNIFINDKEKLIVYKEYIEKRIEYSHCGIPEVLPKLDDRFVFERITSRNIGDIRGRIIPSFSWKDSDTFLRNGFGFLARSREDGTIAAMAFSSAVSPEEVDIGVETAEAHRNHGLASYLAYRMCEEIIQLGRKPVWVHAETNTGSQKTALSVGFKPCGINNVIHKKQ